MFGNRRMIFGVSVFVLLGLGGSALASGTPANYERVALTDHAPSLDLMLPSGLAQNVQGMLGRTWITDAAAPEHVAHMFLLVLSCLLVLALGLMASRRLRDTDQAIAPEAHLSPTVFFELTAGGVFSLMCKMMGREKAVDTFPVVGSLMVVILVSNLMGLVPGFESATGNLNTTLGLGLTVFLLTHYYGVKYNGMAYFKHFMGPLWWLAPLMLPIEIISHLVRPMSLALRLMGNMVGDHKVLGIFLGFGLLVPLPVMALGMLVCIVQALVFCLLTVVYFSMAVEDLSHH